MIQITYPWPPTTNHAYTNVKNRRIKSRTARQYASLATQITQLKHPKPPFTPADRLTVTIDLFPPDARPFDIANREKILIDAISSTLGFNDRQIDQLTITRYKPRDRPHDARAIVTITRITP